MVPDELAADPNPTFAIRTSYSCTITLVSSDGHKESKQFSFKTGPGRLIVSVASGLGITLKDNGNTSGFVFNNQDDLPLIISGLTFDVSFTSLATSTPLVIRFANPSDEKSLADYPIQDIPVDPSSPRTASLAGAKATFAFNIGAHAQRMILVETLGVRKYIIPGVNPEVKIVLKNVGLDRADVNTTLSSAIISWNCEVSDRPYNPFATSTPTFIEPCRD